MAKNDSKELTIGFSPCPNDTFIFHAMLGGLVETGGYGFVPHLHDVEVLNTMAGQQLLDITKLSFFGYLTLTDHYALLRAGGALGFGCGPLVVAKSSGVDLKTARVAVPGQLTTANLLLHLWQPEVKNVAYTRFDNILPGIQGGEFDAGVIIHEGRFVFEQYNCKEIIDLGKWWENETALPIPLGCIAMRKDLIAKYPGIREDVERIIAHSVRFAHDNPSVSRAYIKEHAQELDDRVIDEHIRLYVNEYTEQLGDKGRQAIDKLEEMARSRRIL